MFFLKEGKSLRLGKFCILVIDNKKQWPETEILEGYGLLADACKIFGIDVDLCESVTDRPFF